MEILAKDYLKGRQLGKGAFGVIYLGTHQKTKQQVAIKVEKKEMKYPQLIYEAQLYKFFHRHSKPEEDIGIPRVYFCQAEAKTNVMVMDYLGPSLEQYFKVCGK